MGTALRRRRGRLFSRRQPQQTLVDTQHGGSGGAENPRRLDRKGRRPHRQFQVGTLEKWGFSDAWFERHARHLVRCSITGYGSSGPKAALPGYDFILQAESGLMSICGEPDGKPMKYGVAIVDVCTGMLASNSILAA